jgi:hypothetical protein
MWCPGPGWPPGGPLPQSGGGPSARRFMVVEEEGWSGGVLTRDRVRQFRPGTCHRYHFVNYPHQPMMTIGQPLAP